MNSTHSRSNIMKYFMFRTGRNKTIWIVMMLLNLMGFPLWYLTENLTNSNGVDAHFNDLAQVIPVLSVFCIAISAAIGLFVVYSSFDYLNNKVLCDMIYSAPITNNKRFVSDWLSGLFVTASPFVAGVVIGYIPAIIAELRFGSDMSTRGALNLKYYTILVVSVFFAIVMAYTIGAFVSMCCGTKFEAISYTGICHFIIPISILSTVYTMFDSYSKSGINSEYLFMRIFEPTSPAGILGNMISYFSADTVDDPYGIISYYSLLKSPYLIIVTLIIAILFAATMFLNSKRKAEKCGSPFVFNGLYYVCNSAFAYCLVMFACGVSSFPTTVTIIIVTSIIYLLLEILKNRGFKKLWVGVIRLAVTILLTVGISAVLGKVSTKIIEQVPNASSVSSVEISYTSEINGMASKFEITDPEMIKSVISLQQDKVDEIVKDNNKSDDNEYTEYSYDIYNSATSEVTIKYKMKNLSKMIRSYDVTAEDLYKISSFETSEDYKASYCNQIREIIKELQDEKAEYYDNRYEDKIVVSSILKDNSYESTVEAAVFLEAYIQDYMELSAEEYLMPSEQPLCYVEVYHNYNSDYFLVRKSFKRCIACLESQSMRDWFQNESSVSTFNMSQSNIYLVSPEMKGCTITRKFSKDDGNYDEYGYYDNYDDYGETYEYTDFSLINHVAGTHFDYDKYQFIDTVNEKFVIELDIKKNNFDLNKLLSVMVPVGISEEPLYSLLIDGTTYLIPEEYEYLALAVAETAEKISVLTGQQREMSEEFYQNYLYNEDKIYDDGNPDITIGTDINGPCHNCGEDVIGFNKYGSVCTNCGLVHREENCPDCGESVWVCWMYGRVCKNCSYSEGIKKYNT